MKIPIFGGLLKYTGLVPVLDCGSMVLSQRQLFHLIIDVRETNRIKIKTNYTLSIEIFAIFKELVIPFRERLKLPVNCLVLFVNHYHDSEWMFLIEKSNISICLYLT